MEVFLPIAQVFVNPVEILLLSAIVGVLSGLFGVGGGFLMTPFLIFLGVPPAYAVANEANNILASSSSGALTHWFKKTLDVKMGWLIIAGGLIGTFFGILIFSLLLSAKRYEKKQELPAIISDISNEIGDERIAKINLSRSLIEMGQEKEAKRLLDELLQDNPTQEEKRLVSNLFEKINS